MEDKLQSIEERLNNLKESYPNIVELWINYINVKKKSLEKGLIECEKALDIIEKKINPDLNKQTIAFLYLLNNSI
tara:strand:- start:773 stop:997 length:225 start_codon:yes stop_codon:yes gene_type:complete